MKDFFEELGKYIGETATIVGNKAGEVIETQKLKSQVRSLTHENTVDFKNTILIMTSNIGANYLLEGIKEDGSIDEQCQEMTMNDLKAHFRPEFLNRLDEIISADCIIT